MAYKFSYPDFSIVFRLGPVYSTIEAHERIIIFFLSKAHKQAKHDATRGEPCLVAAQRRPARARRPV
jgi:hypothetical protein